MTDHSIFFLKHIRAHEGHTTKNNLHVQCNNPHKNPKDILYRDRKLNPKIHMEIQKTLNSQSNSEENVQCQKYYNFWLQTVIQSLTNTNRIGSFPLKSDLYNNLWSVCVCVCVCVVSLIIRQRLGSHSFLNANVPFSIVFV
jgi:hypothetical protein